MNRLRTIFRSSAVPSEGMEDCTRISGPLVREPRGRRPLDEDARCASEGAIPGGTIRSVRRGSNV
jgi:hypothetical protein